MKKSKLYSLFLFLLFAFIITSCSNNPITFFKKEGKLVKSNSDTISIEFEEGSKGDFYAYVEFQLKEGRVDWEIVNSKEEALFKGYAVREDEKVYRELTYPSNYLNDSLDKKEEVKDIASFKPLVLKSSGNIDKYTLIITPAKAEGNFTLQWSDRMATK